MAFPIAEKVISIAEKLKIPVVFKLFKEGIENHLRVFCIQDDGRHVAFHIPPPLIIFRNIETDSATDFFKRREYFQIDRHTDSLCPCCLIVDIAGPITLGTKVNIG